MTKDRKSDAAIEMCLPPVARRRFEAMTAEPSDEFAALVRAAGLDPKTSFHGKVLRIDFADADLSGFDFSGADLSCCNLSAAKLDGAIMTGARLGVGTRYLALRGHRGWVRCVAFSPDRSRVVSGGGDGTLRLWDAASGAALGAPLLGHEGQVWSVAFSPDGRRIVSGGDDGKLRLWDAATGAALGEPPSWHEGGVDSVAFSPDGRRTVSGGREGALRLWDAATGAAESAPLRGHVGRVRSVAFSPDGRRMVSGGSDGTLRLWDAATGAALGEPLRGHKGWVISVAFSPDGKRIVSGGRDSTLRLWDATTNAALGVPLHGHQGVVNSVAFSPDGGRIVSGSQDTTLRLWEAASGAALGEPLRGHGGSVSSVAFSPDGGRIVSGGKDSGVLIWLLDPPIAQVLLTSSDKNRGAAIKLRRRLQSDPKCVERNIHFVTLEDGISIGAEIGDLFERLIASSAAIVFLLDRGEFGTWQERKLRYAMQLRISSGHPAMIPLLLEKGGLQVLPLFQQEVKAIDWASNKAAEFDNLVEAICRAVETTNRAPASGKEAGYSEEQGTEKAKTDPDETDEVQAFNARKLRIQIGPDS